MTNSDEDKFDSEHEGRGDNPGVGGVPADGKIEHDEPDVDDDVSEDDDEIRRDNPGVGGVPADEVEPKS